MANTVTPLYTLPDRVGGAGPVRVIKVEHDGGGGDATIYTPSATKQVYLVGMTSSDDDAMTLTFKSGSTTLVPIQLGTNQGIYDKVNGGYYLATKRSEALIVSSNAAVTLLCHVVEAAYFNFETQ